MRSCVFASDIKISGCIFNRVVTRLGNISLILIIRGLSRIALLRRYRKELKTSRKQSEMFINLCKLISELFYDNTYHVLMSLANVTKT